MLETLLTFVKANWIGIVIILAFVIGLIIAWKMGKKKQVIYIINNLIAKAEKEFGSGTGPIKLNMLWAGIYKEIPWYIRVLFPKEEIEGYIKDGLIWLDNLLETQGINLLSYAEEKALNASSAATNTEE
jgi:hypothetical protein